MSIERVRRYLKQFGLEQNVIELEQSSATVEAAAEALGCEPERIAKTISLYGTDGILLLVTAGDTKIDNQKFKERFKTKAKMVSLDEVERLTGYAPGGVCPFDTWDGVTVYLDESLKRFETVYPAAGNGNSGVRMTIEELQTSTNQAEWVDVCALRR